jgi:hypothetical protein
MTLSPAKHSGEQPLPVKSARLHSGIFLFQIEKQVLGTLVIFSYCERETDTALPANSKRSS